MNRLFALLLCLIPFAALAQDIPVETVPYGTIGKQAWLVENHDVPTVTVKMSFREAGSTSDDAGHEGRAQMLAALLSEGAGPLNALAFQEALESHAIRLSFGVNDDRLDVEMQTLTENADKAFELLGLALAEPRLDDDAVKRVKSQMLAALRQMQEQPRYLASRALAKAVFGSHPYASPTEGTASGIAATSRDNLKQYLSRYITAENVQISVVGDIQAPMLKALLDKNLAKLSQKFSPTRQVQEMTWTATPGITIIPKNIPQTIVLMAGQGIPRSDKDFYVAYVLNHLLGGSTLTSKLGNEIRESRGLAYYASTGLQIFDHGAIFSGTFGTRNDQAAEAMKIARQTLKATGEGSITQQEVDEAKSYIIGAWPLTLASNDGLSDMLQVMQRFNLGKDYLKERNNLISAVTREDILRVARRLVQEDKLVVVAVGAPKPALDEAAANEPETEAKDPKKEE